MQHFGEGIFRAAPRRLARLLGLGDTGAAEWRPEELRAILEHQLSAPLSLDLPSSGGASREGPEPAATAGTSGKRIETFDDLFHHPAPPVALLRMVKDFAKANCNHPESVLPNEIATLLYYESIVAARTHAGEQISHLTDDELKAGIGWVLVQPWVDAKTRGLFEEGLSALPLRGSKE
jgi:hypothetical protein